MCDQAREPVIQDAEEPCVQGAAPVVEDVEMEPRPVGCVTGSAAGGKAHRVAWALPYEVERSCSQRCEELCSVCVSWGDPQPDRCSLHPSDHDYNDFHVCDGCRQRQAGDVGESQSLSPPEDGQQELLLNVIFEEKRSSIKCFGDMVEIARMHLKGRGHGFDLQEADPCWPSR